MPTARQRKANQRRRIQMARKIVRGLTRLLPNTTPEDWAWIQSHV